MKHLTHDRLSNVLLLSHYCFFIPMAHTFLRRNTEMCNRILMRYFKVPGMVIVRLLDVVSGELLMKETKCRKRRVLIIQMVQKDGQVCNLSKSY